MTPDTVSTALTAAPSGAVRVALSADDRARLRAAAEALVRARGIVVQASEFLGSRIEQLAGGIALRVVTRSEARLTGLIERALWRGYRLATFRLAGRGPLTRPRVRKLTATASGALTGLVGLPGLAVDLPFTTAVMLRAIAEIAQAQGEDLRHPETRRACIEVLTIGVMPGEDDQPELSYWTARAALSHASVEMTIRQAARLLVVPLSQKFFAQAVPVAGALAGGTLNYVFTDYFQQIARVHFAVRALERRTGDSAAVRACLRQEVEAIRRQRR